MEKDVETQNTYLQSLINSEHLNQTKLSYKIDNRLKTIATCIKKLGEVVVESKPCEMNFVRKKDKQAQMMVSNLLQHMSVQNIQLNLKQMINTKGRGIIGCSLLPGVRLVLSCNNTNTLSFINTEGVELFQISKDKTGPCTYNTVYIKDNYSGAVSSGGGDNKCIVIIDIESQKVMTTIYMDTYIYGMAVRGRTIY
jgi:hypothetical protein